MDDIIYDLDSETVRAHKCFGVFWKSDDFKIHDSGFMCRCATEQLAEKVVAILQRTKDKKLNYDGKSYFIMHPLMHDKEGAFTIVETISPAANIALTLHKALGQMEVKITL